MSSATLNINARPRRMLSANEAAGYCGLPQKRFQLQTFASVMPQCGLQPGEEIFDTQMKNAVYLNRIQLSECKDEAVGRSHGSQE